RRAVAGGGGGVGRLVVAGEELEEEGAEDDGQQEPTDGDDCPYSGSGLDRRPGSGRERTLGQARGGFFAVSVAGGVLGPTGRTNGSGPVSGRRGRRFRAQLELFIIVVACGFLVVAEVDTTSRAELFLPGYGGAAFRANMSCHFAPSTSAE